MGKGRSGPMVGVLDGYGADKCQVVDHLRQMGKAFRNPLSRLTVLLEFPLGRVKGGIPSSCVHEGKPFAFEQRWRNRLAIQFTDPGFSSNNSNWLGPPAI